MIAKPNIPEEIGRVSLRLWREPFKAGAGWMMLVYLTDVPGAYLIDHHKTWPLALRMIIALLPFAARLLYVRGMVRWIRGMDELHRQITVSSFAFSAITYLFLGAACSLMDRAGVF